MILLNDLTMIAKQTDRHTYVIIYVSEFLICFEAWAKLAQHWLAFAPLGRYLEPINKTVNAISDNIIIINCAIWPKEKCAVPNKIWANGAYQKL